MLECTKHINSIRNCISQTAANIHIQDPTSDHTFLSNGRTLKVLLGSCTLISIAASPPESPSMQLKETSTSETSRSPIKMNNARKVIITKPNLMHQYDVPSTKLFGAEERRRKGKWVFPCTLFPWFTVLIYVNNVMYLLLANHPQSYSCRN